MSETALEIAQNMVKRGKEIEQNRILGILVDAEEQFTDSSRIVRYISDRIQNEDE